MLFISEAMAFLLSLSVSSSVILSFVPTYCNQLSTDICRSPFLSRKELRISSSLVLALAFLIFTREYSSSLLQSAKIARSRESVQDSCRPMNALRSYRLENGYAIFSDSEQSSRLLPFLLCTVSEPEVHGLTDIPMHSPTA